MIVDEAARIRAFPDDAAELWQTGLVTVEAVTVNDPPHLDCPA